MTNDQYKQYADKDCPICNGEGYIWVEDLRHPDDPIQTKEYREMCECAIKNYEKD